MENKAFLKMKQRIEAKEFHTLSEARWAINSLSVRGEITQEEYTELRCLINRVYDD